MLGRLVVGVDGSEESRRALQWAIDEAAARGARVQAVAAWRAGLDFGEEFRYPLDDVELAEAARGRLMGAIAETAGPCPPVEVQPIVLEGDPADVLCRQARQADLLVVGSHGRGPFTRWVLGSVSERCAHHTPVPLVIVPAGDRELSANLSAGEQSRARGPRGGPRGADPPTTASPRRPWR